MLETCNSCGTVFDVDENILSHKIQWFKCSVCNEKWNITSKNNETSDKIEVKEEKNKVSTKIKFKDKSEQVKYELASIKTAIEDKTKFMSKNSNHVLEQKNKSVAQIASELSESKVRAADPINTKTENKLINKKNVPKNGLFPFLIIIIILCLFGLIFFRSAFLGFSFLYFYKPTENYITKINQLWIYIKLPVLAELSHINMKNFVATVQDKKVNFSGIIKNTSNRPILVPRVQIIAVREDRKIVLEKIIVLKDKIIMPFSEIKFSEIEEIQSKKENITVKATLLKKIYDL